MHAKNREKIDEKGEMLLFVWYSDESKGYRIFNPITSQLVVLRDAIYDKSAALK